MQNKIQITSKNNITIGYVIKENKYFIYYKNFRAVFDTQKYNNGFTNKKNALNVALKCDDNKRYQIL